MKRADVYALIDAERARQASLWTDKHDWGQGDCSSLQVALPVKVAVLTEECGEVARAVLDLSPAAHLRAELTECAAVCVAWLESME